MEQKNKKLQTKSDPLKRISSNGNSGVHQDVLRGLIYTHNRLNKNTAEAHQANAAIQAVVDLLIERGVIDSQELETRQKQGSEKLRKTYLENGMAVAMQEFKESKYDFQGGAEIDCENRIHLCKAACCRLPLALSKEDVQEGIVKWDLGQPYMITRNGDGYCTHLDHGPCQCTIYEHRPIPCRGYDCRKDKRIWLDFEKNVVNPRIDQPDWPGCLEEEKKTAVPGEDENA